MTSTSFQETDFGGALAPDALSLLVDSYENRVPRVIKGGSLFRLEEVYEAFRRRVAKYADGAGENPGKFFVDGKQVNSGLENYYPSAADQSADDYISRLARDFGRHELLCYGYDFRDASPQIAGRLANFMRLFNSLVTYQPKEVYTELFIGKYQMTAGGIHKEEASNFKMVLHGRKTMVVWPEDTWHVDSENSNDLSDKMSGRVELYLKDKKLHEADAKRVELTGSSGDLIYWPERWWHVGHCDQFTAAVTVPLYY